MKKLVAVVLASFLLTAFSNTAWSAIPGDWNVTVSEKTKVKVKGEKAEPHSETYNDVFSFKSNNDFYMLGKYFGKWSQAGKKYIVNIDPQVFADHVMELEGPDGPQNITVTASSFTAKIKKDGSIKGKFKIKAIFQIDDTPGKFQLKSNFTGTSKSNGENPGDGGDTETTTYTISEYFAPGQGNTWTYVEEDEELTVQTVSGTEQVNGVNAVKIIDEDGDYNLWTHSDGLVFHKIYNADDVPGCGWSQFIFNPPIKVSDPVVSVGSTSASTSTLFYTDCSDGSDTLPISYEITIEGVEDVTVPAGTFNDCLKVKFVLTMNGGADINEDTSWWAKGLGTVKSISISKQNGSVVSTWTDDLVSAVVDGVSYP